LMYAQGLGVTQDYNAAFKWFKLAAEQGYVYAQYNLGIMYEQGYGVTQDFARAYMWWDIAASKGDEDAAGGRADVQKVLTPAQLKKAKNITQQCVAKNYKNC